MYFRSQPSALLSEECVANISLFSSEPSGDTLSKGQQTEQTSLQEGMEVVSRPLRAVLFHAGTPRLRTGPATESASRVDRGTEHRLDKAQAGGHDLRLNSREWMIQMAPGEHATTTIRARTGAVRDQGKCLDTLLCDSIRAMMRAIVDVRDHVATLVVQETLRQASIRYSRDIVQPQGKHTDLLMSPTDDGSGGHSAPRCKTYHNEHGEIYRQLQTLDLLLEELTNELQQLEGIDENATCGQPIRMV